MTQLTVGKPSPFAGLPEGCIFDFDEAGAILICTLNRPTVKEIQSFSVESPLQIRFVRIDGVLFMLFKFGWMSWMDAPYDIRLTKCTKFPELGETQGYAMTIVLQDQMSAVVKSLRFVGIGHDFSMALKAEIFSTDISAPLIKPEYDSRVSNIYRKYTTEQMVGLSSYYFNLR